LRRSERKYQGAHGDGGDEKRQDGFAKVRAHKSLNDTGPKPQSGKYVKHGVPPSDTDIHEYLNVCKSVIDELLHIHYCTPMTHCKQQWLESV
jgi:hypothetical protein